MDRRGDYRRDRHRRSRSQSRDRRDSRRRERSPSPRHSSDRYRDYRRRPSRSPEWNDYGSRDRGRSDRVHSYQDSHRQREYDRGGGYDRGRRDGGGSGHSSRSGDTPRNSFQDKSRHATISPATTTTSTAEIDKEVEQMRMELLEGQTENPLNKPVTKNVRRPGYGTVDDTNRVPLLVNYFKITIPKVVVYCYDIEITPGVEMKSSSFGGRGRGFRGRGRGRGGRGGGNYGSNPNFPPNFKPIEGKLRKQICNEHNRQVLEQLRKQNCIRPADSFGPGDLFYDKDEACVPEAQRRGIDYVYDGVKNFYTIKPLNGLLGSDADKITEARTHQETIDLNQKSSASMTSSSTSASASELPSPASNLRFDVKVMYATTVDLDSINQFISGHLPAAPQDAFKAVDIIMRHGPTVDSVVLGHGIYKRNNGSGGDKDGNYNYKLTGGKTLQFGHYQTMKSCAVGPTLNIDRCSAVFIDTGPLIHVMASALDTFKDVPVTTFIEELSNLVNQGGYQKKSFGFGGGQGRPSRNMIDELTEKFSGVKVSTAYGSYRRSFKLSKITYQSASKLYLVDFQSNNNQGNNKPPGTVASYFKEKYNIHDKGMELLPCAQFGTAKRPVYIPLTLLQIDSNQNVSKLKAHETISLIKHCSSQPTSARFNVIKKAASHVVNCDNAKKTLSSFGLEMVPEPVKLEAFILDHPTLVYGEKDGVKDNVEGDKMNDANQNVVFGKEQFKPEHGRWSLSSDHKLHTTNRIDMWMVVNFVDRLNEDKIHHFVSRLLEISHQIGMKMDKPRKVHYYMEYIRNHTLQNDFKRHLTSIHGFDQEHPYNLLTIFIFDKKDDALYQDIKYYSDVVFNITNQCVSDKVIDLCWNARQSVGRDSPDKTPAPDFNPLSNILLKINTKFCGINNLISDMEKDEIIKDKTMIIGADVTHPEDGKLTTSIAAITATYDADHIFYYPCVRVQFGYSEIIQCMYDMFYEIGDHFYRRNQFFPNHILFYRDGVSDGMFAEIFEKEIDKIKDALKDLSMRYLRRVFVPKITFVIVQKRHHTRFMVNDHISNYSPDADQNKDDVKKDEEKKLEGGDEKDLIEFSPKSLSPPSLTEDEKTLIPKYLRHKFGNGGNIFGGVTIDTKIVHPFEYDFFLCSQDCVQGTPRPAHYYVLLDEINLKPDALYKVTFQLCHTYAPATRSISIPAPVQYAHLAAKRSRQHLIASRAEKVAGVTVWQKIDALDLMKKTAVINDSISIKSRVKERMYFI